LSILSAEGGMTKAWNSKIKKALEECDLLCGIRRQGREKIPAVSRLLASFSGGRIRGRAHGGGFWVLPHRQGERETQKIRETRLCPRAAGGVPKGTALYSQTKKFTDGGEAKIAVKDKKRDRPQLKGREGAGIHIWNEGSASGGTGRKKPRLKVAVYNVPVSKESGERRPTFGTKGQESVRMRSSTWPKRGKSQGRAKRPRIAAGTTVNNSRGMVQGERSLKGTGKKGKEEHCRNRRLGPVKEGRQTLKPDV